MNIEKKDIQYIKTLLTTVLNVDFLPYKDSTVMRRVEKRMTALQFTEAKDYINYLKKHGQELRILGEDIFINVTDFFRDPHVFQKIKQQILPVIFSQKKRTIKFWVAGCATGEEAYSLAILVKEFCEENNYTHKIKIIATDIKEEAINKARQGVYTVKEILGVNRQRLRRFFDREGDKYRIKKHIRSEVIFAIHDITADPPFARVDLLSCRNLLIYLDKENQQKVLASLVFALNIDGFLLLGKSETAVDLNYDLKNISSVYKIYKRIKNTHTTRRLNFDISYQDSLLPVLVPPNENDAHMKEHELTQSFQHIIHQKYAPAVVIIDEQFYVKHITRTAKEYIDTPEDYTKIYSLTSLAPEAVTALVRAAISEIKKGKTVNIYPPLPITHEGDIKQVAITVESLSIESDNTSFYSIIFEEQQDNGKASVDVAKRINLALQSQLADTEANLQKTIEKLENTNQNLLASNEELQSTNEEYISVNEELQTINSEYQDTINELSISNKDVDHLLQSTDIGTVFLDDKLHIRKFTNPIKNLINIDDIDLKRPLKNFTHNLKDINIYQEVKAVLDNNKAIEKEVVSEDDVHYLMRATPYDVDEEHRKGIVLSFINIQQLIEAEKALAESELLYRSVFDYANDGIVLVNESENEKKVSNVNQRQLDMLGYTKEEYLKKTFREVFTEAQSDRQTIESKIKRCKTKSKHEAIEWTLEKKDNTLIETEISTVNMPPPYEGYTLNIIRDITQKKQAQLEILASQKRFQAVFDASPVGISIADMKSNMIRVNKAFARMTGYTSKQLSRMAFSDITYYEDRKPNKEHLEALTSGKRKVISFEKRYVKKDGNIFWAKLWVSMLDDGSGEQLFLANIQNITKEKQSKKALKDSELRYRSLFEKNIEAVIIYDAKNNKILSANKSACKLFECSKKYLLEQTPMDFFPEFQVNGEPSLVFFSKQMQGYAQTGEIRHFMQLITKKGKTIEVELTTFQLYDSPDSEMVVQFKNITEQKAAQHALQESEQRFRNIYENSGDAIVLKDLSQQNATLFNARFTEMTGYTEEEFEKLGGAAITLEPQADGRSAYAHHEEHMKILDETGYCFVENWLLIHKDGHIIRTDMSISKLYDDRNDALVIQFRDVGEKYEAQQALKASEQRFRSVYQNSGEAILLEDLTNYKVINFNPQVSKITGFTEDDFQKITTKDMVSELQADGRSSMVHFEEQVQIILEKGFHFVEDFQMKHKDGHLIWTDMSLSKLYDDRDDIIVVQFHDVSARHQAQEVIKASEARFRSLFEYSADAISVFNTKDLSLIDCNKRTLEIFGLTRAEYIGKNPGVFSAEIQADGRPIFEHIQEHIAIVEKQGHCLVENWLSKRADGTEFYSEFSLSLFSSGSDEQLYLVQLRDTTEKLQAQQAIKASEERFRSLFEHSADAVSIIDSQKNTFLDTNRKSVEMFGYSKAELMTKMPKDLSATIQADGRPASEHIRELIVTVKKDGYYFVDNWINKRADGTEFYTEVSVISFPVPNEHIFIIQRKDVTERLEDQQEIQRQKDYLRTIIDYIPLIVTVKDTEGNYLLTNHVATEAFGMPVNKVIGRNDEEFKSRYGWRRVLDSDKKVAETGEVLHINDIVAEDPNGEIRYGQATKVPIKNEDGEVTQILTVVNDITEIKLAEKLLKEQKEYLNTIINLTPSMITAKDTEGNFILANQAATAIYGVPIEDLIGKNRKTFDFGFGSEKSLAGDKKVIETGEIQRYDDAIVKMANGEERTFQITKVPLKNDAEEIIQVLAVANDITELKQIERDLRESETKFRAVFENSHAVLTILDKDCNIIEQNKTLMGEDKLNVGGPAWESGWFSHDKNLMAQVKKALKKVAKGKTMNQQFAYPKTPDSVGYITSTAKPIYADNGKDILFLLAESIEITELVQSQQALASKVDELNHKNEELKKYIDSNMQLENFAYITSHDLREPLRTISGFASLLEKNYLGKLDETADEYLGYILTSTKNMNALIEDLLVFSRVHTGEHKVEKLNLDDLLFQVIRSLDSSIQDTGAVVTYENIPEVINANDTKMKQLFQNLIANAIKFRKPDTTPEVRITAKSKGELWEFSVQDNGIGISDEYFDKIFMIFKRLHTKDEYEGTGIGLSLCKKIVEQHGGEIHLESKEGEGTTFYFTIEK